MSENNRVVCFAHSIKEVLYQMKTVKDLQIVGGCSCIKKIPEKMLPIRGIHELSTISKHERYIDFGPAVTLGQILSLGKTKMPSVLYQAAKSIATPFVRNIATIGGNICSLGQKLTLYAPLLALGARLEFQNSENTIRKPITQFKSIPQGYILTKIRVPVENWDISFFKRTGPSHRITNASSSYAFVATIENNVLTNVRIAFAGTVSFRSVELENRMLGAKLPLPFNTLDSIVKDASSQFDKFAEDKSDTLLFKNEFLRLVACSFYQLT